MSYFEWVEAFSNLKTSPMDYDYIKKLETKKLDGSEYVEQRLIDHIIETVNVRLNNSYERCVRKALTTNIDINTLSLELVNFRKEKKFVKTIVSLPIMDTKIRDTFMSTIDKKVDAMCIDLRKSIEYIDYNGEYVSTFDKIMVSDVEE